MSQRPGPPQFQKATSRASASSSPRMWPVYHMTDTINLPWILASGELRPTWNCDTGIGPTRFLWGTTDPLGDYTSGPQMRIHGDLERDWRAGVFHLVRFTLAADEFFTWNEIVEASNWTPEEVAALIRDDQRRCGEYGHQNWRLRHDPIPLSRVLKVETTSFEDAETEQWWPLDIAKSGRNGYGAFCCGRTIPSGRAFESVASASTRYPIVLITTASNHGCRQ